MVVVMVVMVVMVTTVWRNQRMYWWLHTSDSGNDKKCIKCQVHIKECSARCGAASSLRLL
jgi:hypothetical protein